MGWFSDQIKKRKENNQKAFEDSFVDLAGLNNSEEKSTRENFILLQLSRYFGMENIKVPSKLTEFTDKVRYASKVLGIVARKIILTEGWYRDNREPILVFTKENDTPILLLPKGSRGFYYISYQNGKKVKGTVSMAKLLKQEAYTFHKPVPNHKLTFKEYFQYFRRTVRFVDLLFVVLMSIVTIGIGMILPYLTKTLTGEVVDNKDLNLYLTITIFMISAGVVYILIKTTQTLVNLRVAIKIEKVMQETTMMRLLSLPPSFFKKYSTGELASRFYSVSTLSSILFNGVFLTVLSSVMSLAFVTQIIQFAPVLILPVIAILVLTTAFSIFISLLQMKVSRKQLLLSSKESGSSYSMINGIQKIRLAGAEKRAFAMWAKDYAKASEPLYHPPLIIRIAPVISLFISLAGTIVIYFIAAKNNIDVSSFMAFTSSFATLSAAASMFSEIGSTLSRIKPVLEMARPILEADLEDDETKENIEELKGNIRLENVCFKYSSESRDILKDINIDIKEGEYIGIVGKTGCGKSTLVRLLLGFEQPTSGNIYFDDKDMNKLNLQSLRSKIGSVTQNGGVFHADILSNIIITAPHLGEEEAWQAAEIAGIAEDIRNMPMGMKTMISEGQGGISGGQKQRIMIARAIINKPKVLLFDEATSALDNKCQKQITKSLDELRCTRIVVAHRLSTIKSCDRILYMEDGQILEEGNYDQLIALNGKFKELIERQKLD